MAEVLHGCDVGCELYDLRCGDCPLQGGPNCDPACPKLPDNWECPLEECALVYVPA